MEKEAKNDHRVEDIGERILLIHTVRIPKGEEIKGTGGGSRLGAIHTLNETGGEGKCGCK